MNLPDWHEKDSMDHYLGAQLKRWAARETSPGDGLARLLGSAAIQKPTGSLSRIDLLRRWLMTGSDREFDVNFVETFLYQPKVSYPQLNMICVY